MNHRAPVTPDSAGNPSNAGSPDSSGNPSNGGSPNSSGDPKSAVTTPTTTGSAATPHPASRQNAFWSVFGRIWAIWVIVIFVATMLVVLIPFLLFSYFRPDPQKTKVWVWLSRVWMNVFLPLAGCPLRIRGREKFAAGQSYVVVCNHNALVDVPVSYPFIPGGNKTIAKIEMARIPIFGLFYSTGSVLVDRNSEASRRDSFTKMKEVLEMGLHMCIYPEGTRNKTAEPLKSFHDGAFRLAASTGHAILPAIIFNTKKVMPASEGFFFRPCPLYLHFLDPVALQPGESVESLKNRVFAIMSAYYAAGPKAPPRAR